ncbi:hypothetical protein PIB30_097466 [Stylosanthes scabra]|uniref:Uncharacterized protein n=1 Tax=Stylosanthes scabra TaxID=79078 RepID=A0ABU6XW19_9FABA|nr:hypothetical protein [Stylosanthes scabra]
MRKAMIKSNTNTLSNNFSNRKQVFSKIIGNSSNRVFTSSMSNLQACNFSNNNFSRTCKEAVEKLEQTMGVQQQEMTKIKKQLKEWTRHAYSRDAYCYWAHQQANPNMIEIPIHQIPDLIQANAENGRHIIHGALKSQLVAGSSSQAPPPQPADEPMADPKN